MITDKQKGIIVITFEVIYGFSLTNAYLHLALTHCKGQGQSHAQFG